MARNTFEASTNGLRATVSTSLFARVSYLWIKDIVKQYDVPEQVLTDLKQLSLVASFMSDATSDTIQWNARALATDVVVLRN